MMNMEHGRIISSLVRLHFRIVNLLRFLVMPPYRFGALNTKEFLWLGPVFSLSTWSHYSHQAVEGRIGSSHRRPNETFWSISYHYNRRWSRCNDIRKCLVRFCAESGALRNRNSSTPPRLINQEWSSVIFFQYGFWSFANEVGFTTIADVLNHEWWRKAKAP